MNNTTSLTIFDLVFPHSIERAAIPFIMIIIIIIIVVLCTICIGKLHRKYGFYSINKVYPQHSDAINIYPVN